MTQPISRRAVARSAAWSIPVVAVAGATPAMAGSAGCASGPVTVNLGAGVRTKKSLGASGMPSQIEWAYTDSATGVTVTITTTAIGDTILGRRTGHAENTYQDTDLVFDGNGLNVQHVTRSGSTPGSGGEGQNVTIAFSRKNSPVTVTSFVMRIEDIDSKVGEWTDGVAITGGAVTSTKGSNIDGNGTVSNRGGTNTGPWHAAYDLGSDPSTSVNLPKDRVDLAAASLTSLSLRYFNLPSTDIKGASAGVNSDQNIQLAGMQFTAPSC